MCWPHLVPLLVWFLYLTCRVHLCHVSVVCSSRRSEGESRVVVILFGLVVYFCLRRRLAGFCQDILPVLLVVVRESPVLSSSCLIWLCTFGCVTRWPCSARRCGWRWPGPARRCGGGHGFHRSRRASDLLLFSGSSSSASHHLPFAGSMWEDNCVATLETRSLCPAVRIGVPLYLADPMVWGRGSCRVVWVDDSAPPLGG